MRLYVYGGDKYENRRMIGDWDKLPPQQVFSEMEGLSVNRWSFGVGIIDSCPTLILRTLQTDKSTGRYYPFVLLIDVGEENWKRFGWNAAEITRVLIESKHFDKLRFRAEDVVLADLQRMLASESKRPQKKAHKLEQLKESIAGSIEFKSTFCIGVDKSVYIDDLAYIINQIPPCFRCGNGWIVGGTNQQAEKFGVCLFIELNNKTTGKNANLLVQKGHELLEFCENNKESLIEVLNIPRFYWNEAETYKFNNLRKALEDENISRSPSNSETNEPINNERDSLENILQYSEDSANNSEQSTKEWLDSLESVKSNIQLNPRTVETIKSINLTELNEYLNKIKEGQSNKNILITYIHTTLSKRDNRLELLEKFFSIPPEPLWQDIFDSLPDGLQDEIVCLAYKHTPKTFSNIIIFFYEVTLSHEKKIEQTYACLATAISYFLLNETNKDLYQELTEKNGESFVRNVKDWKEFTGYLAQEENANDWTIDDESNKESEEITRAQELYEASVEGINKPRFWIRGALIVAGSILLIVISAAVYFYTRLLDSPTGNISNMQTNVLPVTPVPLKFSDTETQELYNKLSKTRVNSIESIPVGKEVSTEVFQKTFTQLAEIINKTNWKLTIEIHTDLNGTPENNLKIASDRAKKIQESLAKLGVKGDQIKTIVEGDKSPLYQKPKDNVEAEKNRRIVIRLSP